MTAVVPGGGGGGGREGFDGSNCAKCVRSLAVELLRRRSPPAAPIVFVRARRPSARDRRRPLLASKSVGCKPRRGGDGEAGRRAGDREQPVIVGSRDQRLLACERRRGVATASRMTCRGCHNFVTTTTSTRRAPEKSGKNTAWLFPSFSLFESARSLISIKKNQAQLSETLYGNRRGGGIFFFLTVAI